MNKTRLVLKYYFPCDWLGIGKKTKWNVYHAGCYNCIAKQRISGGSSVDDNYDQPFESHAFHVLL